MKVVDVVNDTSDFFMQYRGSRWMDNAFLIETPPIGVPQFYSFNGVDANGDNAVDVYPKPDGVYQLALTCVTYSRLYRRRRHALVFLRLLLYN